MGWWPLSLLGPLIAYHLIVLMFPPLRRSYIWLGFGRFSKDVILLMLITIVISSLALIIWARFMNLDLSLYLDQMSDIPLVWMPFLGLGFAVLNAAMEEFAFRGIIMNGMDFAFNIPVVSVTSQAISFGLLHYMSGFPNGILGVIMTFVYGLLLAVIRNRSRGMTAPVVAHFFADLTIFTILVTLFL